MGTRLELHEKLCERLASRNVYFQPPETLKMKYPCIVYNLSDLLSKPADNHNYKLDTKYQVTYITRDPDDISIREILTEFSLIRFDRAYVSDNLYHYVYTLYF